MVNEMDPYVLMKPHLSIIIIILVEACNRFMLLNMLRYLDHYFFHVGKKSTRFFQPIYIFILLTIG